MQILDGKKIAQNILDSLQAEVAGLSFVPVFCDVVVGNDPVSLSYVKIKGKTAEEVGLTFRIEQLPETISQPALLERITTLNQIKNLSGLIVQLPLPAGMDRQKVLDAIDPKLDVDCLGQATSRNFYSGQPTLVPPTAAAILAVIEQLPREKLSGNFVVVGRGQLVGRPVQELLQRRGFRVTSVDQSTKDLPRVCKTADVLICGTGRPGLITPEYVKQGAAVIDAGTAEVDGGIVGDVDFENVRSVADFISPVPGGVGPVTVSMLLYNVVAVAKKKQNS